MNDHLTKLPNVPSRRDVIPGMAHFSGTGPAGETCGTCEHLGYYRETKKGKWDERLKTYVTKSYKWKGCAMFRKLTGSDGPTLEDWHPSCKYFERRKTT